MVKVLVVVLAVAQAAGCGTLSTQAGRAPDSYFGKIRSFAPSVPHRGVDWYAGRGADVHAAHGGLAWAECWNERRGYRVHVSGKVGGRAVTTVYQHLDECLVGNMDEVRTGDVVGRIGTTGPTQGDPAHLHFELRVNLGRDYVDPWPWIVDGRLHHPLRPVPQPPRS